MYFAMHTEREREGISCTHRTAESLLFGGNQFHVDGITAEKELLWTDLPLGWFGLLWYCVVVQAHNSHKIKYLLCKPFCFFVFSN